MYFLYRTGLVEVDQTTGLMHRFYTACPSIAPEEHEAQLMHRLKSKVLSNAQSDMGLEFLHDDSLPVIISHCVYRYRYFSQCKISVYFILLATSFTTDKFSTYYCNYWTHQD